MYFWPTLDALSLFCFSEPSGILTKTLRFCFFFAKQGMFELIIGGGSKEDWGMYLATEWADGLNSLQEWRDIASEIIQVR